jgi:hypothetical protein
MTPSAAATAIVPVKAVKHGAVWSFPHERLTWQDVLAAPLGIISAARAAEPANDVVFVVNTQNPGLSSGIPLDPTVATSSGPLAGNGIPVGIPQVVLAGGNTYASFSTNGGQTFVTLDPTAIFPNTDDGGVCCDQVIHYSPDIDRFFWLMQFNAGSNGKNRLRLAIASPADLRASGGTAWSYWDLTAAFYGVVNTILDYPDLSVGKNSLFISVDGDNGLVVSRIALSQLLAGGTIFVQFTSPADGQSAYGVHLIQNPWDQVFWAGHPTNSRLRVFSIKDGDNQYHWRDVDIDSYPNSDFTSLSPDGSNWLGSLFSGGPGGVRLNVLGVDQVMFEWMGGRGGNFKQSQVQMATIKLPDYSVISQTQIWNPDFAFGYASFTMANSLIGVSLAYGGGGWYGSPAVGILGDGVFYSVCESSSNAGRFGDYATVRQALPGVGGLLSAEVYCRTPADFDPHYVLFGRSSDIDPPPIG